jgi:nicotinamide-nucleotide amidase
MTGPGAASDAARRTAEAASGRSVTVAVAESLTGGMISARLAAAESASTWFRGGLVAYGRAVKHDVLGVDDGPVVSDAAARQMAAGVRDLLGADIAVAVTGVGGPGPQDDHEPGTVFVAIVDASGARVDEHAFEGSPERVCAATADAALEALAARLA